MKIKGIIKNIKINFLINSKLNYIFFKILIIHLETID